MTTKELERIYAQACATKGFEPSDGQFKTWKALLLWFEARDVQRAVEMYFETETGFPMPAEVRVLSFKALRIRQAKASSVTLKTIWQCPDCRMTQTGFIAPGADTMRRCSGPGPEGKRGTICGGRMEVQYQDEPEQAN